MKNIISLFVIIIVLVSCNNDDSTNSTVINPNLLQRVDFFSGTSYEKRWCFNSNGFLEEIKDANGILLEKFVYNSNNQVIQNLIYENGIVTQTLNISYSSNNIISEINGNPFNYNSTENKYYDSDGLFYNYNCNLNSEFLMKSSSAINDDPDYYYEYTYNTIYIENNMFSFSSYDTNTFQEIFTFYEFDNNVNPLKQALMPVFKVKSITNPKFYYDSLSSANNIISQGYLDVDPEYHTYDYTFNSNNLPVNQTRNDYYLDVFENSIESKHYYYQGDIIPN
ncbi:MAG: hypothetical protein R2805_12035 [Flavobacterium sp.]|jgi:hypothetical protein|uniref:hypothetical protein n=1 Tax=Flavobacterium sp. TaxID=239 RepID=UPI002FD8F5C7|nr:hypothetical protein [Bacteroidota bacterium]